MSYSRRQLYAMGETLGECVTRKEGGRIIYGGGGSPSAPEKTTQISDLPDWAKPSAQKLLGKAEALTEGAPYQQYQGERVAGFSPLQQQAFQGATTMDAGPQGFAQNVGNYMSPYMQNVVDREKMEAARASQMLGQQQQAKATQAGAFGGYREAIERAERERGLRSQLGDIQTRGLQSAYDRAADQFRTGITQGLAVGQQQASLGGQQQQLEQQRLSQQYQDFQNQQRYPYQQLEFMSNILRGTPMGTVQTMYSPPPNTLGTLAGLGIGAYGMFGKAEGGMVDSYAEGGVTSDQNVESILSKLSDEQLMRAKQIAMAQRDGERVQMIDAELAERASMKQGLGGAFNMLPQEQQEAVTEMAGGGIVAFADGGLNDPEYQRRLAAQSQAYVIGAQEAARQRALQEPAPTAPAPIDFETATANYDAARSRAAAAQQKLSAFGLRQRQRDPAGYEAARQEVEQTTAALPALQSVFEKAVAARGLDRPAFNPSQVRASTYGAAAQLPQGSAPTAPAAPTVNVGGGRSGGQGGPTAAELTAYRASQRPAPAAPAKAPARGVAAAAEAVADAAAQTTGTARTPMKTAFTEGLAMLKDEQGEADSKRMVDLINKLSKSEAPDKMEMLANFGFRMAAAASKPGARFLGAAAEGAQVVPEMRAQAKKDAKEAQRLGATLEIEKLKLDAANRRGDRTAALQHAQNIRIMEGQEAQLAQGASQLAETRRSNLAREGLQARQIAASEKRYAASQGRMGETMARIRAANAQKAMTQATKDWGDPLKNRELKQQYPTVQAYQAALFKDLQLQSMPQLELLGAVSAGTE